jgi:hypothetical protein
MGRGPAPKAQHSRPRDTARRTAPNAILTGEPTRGPDLPDSMTWPEQTRHWWETWRTSPQSQVMLATDWDFLLDTAILHARFWTGESTTVAAELRLRVAKFGATPEDRARLRMQVGEPDKVKADPGSQSPYSHLKAAV